VLAGKGTGGLAQLKGAITDNFVGFGYLRVATGKFVLIKYAYMGARMTTRALLNLHVGDVTKVFNQITLAVDVRTKEELTEEDIAERINRPGAHYGSG
jgi:hypothetical protein